jgi:RNA recognition motif-containing protein
MSLLKFKKLEYTIIFLIYLQTGKSRGYGYIEFKLPEVAKIAAETMNNYLMCGRLLKSK